MRCIRSGTAVITALSLASCAPTSRLLSAPPGANRGVQSVARATGKSIPRARFLRFETADEKQRSTLSNGGPCGMLDAFPPVRSAKEAAFATSYRRALRAHGDCPLVWKKVRNEHRARCARRGASAVGIGGQTIPTAPTTANITRFMVEVTVADVTAAAAPVAVAEIMAAPVAGAAATAGRPASAGRGGRSRARTCCRDGNRWRRSRGSGTGSSTRQ